jgi:hypothetical protein
MENINEAQEIQFRRLGLCEYIGGDRRTSGKTVAKDLRGVSELWDAFVFGRFTWGQLIELRDLPKGHLNADTLYIMTTRDRKKDMRAVIDSWCPDVCIATQPDRFDDELSAHTRQIADMLGLSEMPKDVVVFQVWWD